MNSSHSVDEEELARLNQEYMDAKVRAMPPEEPPIKKDPPKRKVSATFCCAPVILLLAIIALIAMYFSSNAFGSVQDDTADALNKLNTEIIPKAKDELKKSIDQGESLYNETRGNVENLNDQYDETKQLIDDANKIYNELKQ